MQDFVTVDDTALWQATLDTAAQRGTLILTGHFGNWELLAYAHGLLGHPITLVHRPMNNTLVDDAIIGMRERAGTVSLPKKSAAKAALRALHRQQIVAIPADQNQTRRYGVFVDFFGLPASTTPGPARLAMLSGAPVVPVFLVREGDSEKHRIVVLPEVELVKQRRSRRRRRRQHPALQRRLRGDVAPLPGAVDLVPQALEDPPDRRAAHLLRRPARRLPGDGPNARRPDHVVQRVVAGLEIVPRARMPP